MPRVMTVVCCTLYTPCHVTTTSVLHAPQWELGRLLLLHRFHGLHIVRIRPCLAPAHTASVLEVPALTAPQAIGIRLSLSNSRLRL